MVTIRAIASPDDVATARALFYEYAASVSVDLCFQSFDAELAGLPGAYAPPAGVLLLAESAGRAIGCVALRPFDPPSVAEMKRLYVRPAGRGLGAGKALTEAVLTAARRAGYDRVRLDTLPEMADAQALYRKLGFLTIAPYRHNPEPGTVFMEFTLASAR